MTQNKLKLITILANLLVTHLIQIDRDLTYKLINSISEFIDLNIKDIETYEALVKSQKEVNISIFDNDN